MPIANMEPVATCGDEMTVVSISNEGAIAVVREDPFEIGIIPRSALPCEGDLMDAATFRLGLSSYPQVFFADNRTLCLIEDVSGAGEPVLTKIMAFEDEFRNRSTAKTDHELPRLDGYYVLRDMLPTVIEHETNGATSVLLLCISMTRVPEGTPRDHHNNFGAELMVTLTGVECAEPAYIPHFPPQVPRAFRHFHNAGTFICDSESRPTIYYDTGVDLVHWMQPRGVSCGNRNGRWVLTRDENKVLLFDAAERSSEPCAEFAVTQRGWPSVKSTGAGEAILIHENTVYKFKELAVVQPLEILAAMAAWKHLPEEKRMSLAECPFEYDVVLQACTGDEDEMASSVSTIT